IIGADEHAEALRPEPHPVGSHFLAAVFAFLIHVGRGLADFAAAALHAQRAVGIDLDGAGAFERDADPARIGAGTHDEVVFKAAFVAVVNDVDAGVHIGVLHLVIGWYA